MSVPRILLLTDSPPNYKESGGIFLHDLCLYYPRESLRCFSVCNPSQFLLSQDLTGLITVYGRRPMDSIRYGHRLRKLGFQRLVLGITSPISFLIWQNAKVRIRVLISKAIQFGKEQGIEMVWTVLCNPTLIYMARRVSSALGVPLVTTVLDPPEYWLTMNSAIDILSRCSIIQEFKNTLKASTRCSVVSEEMQNEYEKAYGVDTVIMRHGIHPNMRKPPAKELNDEKRFVIGFAGSLYAIREWQALMSALSKLNWQIHGRDITIVLLGKHLYSTYRDNTHIEYLGWRSIEETIDLMSKTDVTYLPYWFDESYRLAARLCFPSKLTTYLASGRPVLFHGPEDSSVTGFVRRFPIGICCHSLKEEAIVECLQQFTDNRFYASATEAGQKALDQELDLRVFLKPFGLLQ